jgi:hypothetical protein
MMRRRGIDVETRGMSARRDETMTMTSMVSIDIARRRSRWSVEMVDRVDGSVDRARSGCGFC